MDGLPHQEAPPLPSIPSLFPASESKAGATGESGVNPTAYHFLISTSRPFLLEKQGPETRFWRVREGGREWL